MFSLMTVVVITTGVLFICSIWETSLYSVPAARVEALRQQGKSSGKRLALLREKMDRPIAAILCLNTTTNTLGATIAGILAHQYLGGKYVPYFSAGMVLVFLVCSEIIPKTLGFAYASRLAPLFAWPVQLIIWALYPAVALTEWFTGLIRPSPHDAFPTEDDILSVAHLGARGGGILPEELKWVKNVLKLNNIQAQDIMTPRSVMDHLPAGLSLGELREQAGQWTHSRIVVTKDGDPDQVLGIVLRHEVIAALCAGHDETRLRELLRPAQIVPFSMRGHHLLSEMIKLRQHLFIVVDEYGGTLGLVTLEDVIEAMLGEQIVDESDVHPSLRELARKKSERYNKKRN